MNLFNFNEFEIITFFLVLTRMSGFMVSWPIFGVRQVPPQIKVLFSFLVSILIFPFVTKSGISAGVESYTLLWLPIKEIFIGLSIGFLARFFFYAISIAGQIISVSMGLSGIQLFNPALGERSTAIDQFLVMIASLLFLAIDGHHMLLIALIKSYELVPLSHEFINIGGFASMGFIFKTVMELGIQLSAPVLVAILIMNIVMAIVGRAVPQITVLITSLPVNILVGFVVLIVSIPIILYQMENIMEITGDQLFKFIKSY